MVMTRQQVYGVLSDPVQAVNSGCTESYLKLLSAALENYPKKGRNQPQLSAAGGETCSIDGALRGLALPDLPGGPVRIRQAAHCCGRRCQGRAQNRRAK